MSGDMHACVSMMYMHGWVLSIKVCMHVYTFICMYVYVGVHVCVRMHVWVLIVQLCFYVCVGCVLQCFGPVW